MKNLSSYGGWAVVTGASSGIGLAFARRCAADGLNVVLAARSADRLRALGRELSNVDHRVVPVDLSRPDGAADLLSATADLDVGVLVSNAGNGTPGRFLDQEPDDLRQRLTLNTVTHLELAHAFGRRFVQRGGGAIVLVSALGAIHGLPNMAHESASKAYVLNLGEALHHELAASGVKVTVMLPGNVDTPIIDRFGVDRARLPISPFPAGKAVDQTIHALLTGRATIIPDRRMRAATRLTPRGVSIRMNGRMLAAASANLARHKTPAHEGAD
ncbi:SDR family NAD(P)-dependent oxidoreductase [Amorphoplanes digitatis]|uniref:Short-subunit dehydrogenase n=1 Tax=Actinoplanes digitatis TaxID=1868 RepID=A0A7W7HVJ2_9ACTN|nr:SDR family NAD(P)-dependent oxidoreductase [Actinoplanes digitatis]MBB4761574.1 short-subunit dehydrogenase [Actinoplanes digitatis]GID90683.1 short-chain dehydrogenase [Actinoplanes digitatis]